MKTNHLGVQARLLAAAGLVLAASLPALADYQSTVLSQGPIGYWRLNETTQPPPNGTTPNLGSLGASANGVYNNSPTHELPGPFTGSLAVGLDGLNQSVTTPWQSALNSNVFSVEMWLNPEQVPFFAYPAASVHAGSAAPGRSGWYLAQDDGSVFGLGSAFVLRFFSQNGTTPSITLSAPVATAGVWYHLVFTYDGTTATLYTNGVIADSGTPSAYVGNVDAQFSIGSRSDNSFYWPGQAAEVAMYTTALSAARVASHYTTATTTPANYVSTVQADAPVLYHRYREASDVTAENLGTFGSALSAKYQVGTTPGQVGPRPSPYPGFETTNNAVGLNASGAVVSAPAFNIDTNTVTISGWVRATTNMENSAAGIILCDAGTTYAGLTIDVPFGGLGLGYVWNNEPASYNWSPTADAGLPTLPESDWAYVALVVQPDQAAVFIATTNNAGSFTGATNYLQHVNQKFDGPTLFGSDSGLPDYSFLGNIDEVAFFDRALGVGELYTQYASAVGNVPVRIFADPQSPIDPLYVGDTLTLAVDAGGSPNLSFQWYKSSGAIANATNRVFTKTDIQTSDSDNYYCIITNPVGSIQSASASITVEVPFQPAIITSPVARSLYPGATLNLSVVADGGGLKYQWKKDNVEISGATASTYQIPSVTTNDSGSYSVDITNNVGNVTGGPVTITILEPANAYEAAIVADAPEAWYRLNETSGTSMFDSMGRHDGTYTNVSGSSVTLGAAGAVVGSSDTAVTFDGTSQSYGIAPYSPLLNGQTFSIEAWMKTTDTTTEMCSVSSRSGTPKGYWLWTYPSGAWSGGVSQGGTDYYVGSDTASDGIVAGEWKHVVMVYDTSLKVYVNGQWDGSGYGDFDRNAGAPFIIGALGGSSIDDLFNGQVDEVLVYTNALTLEQAQNHYSLARFPNPIKPFFLVVPSSDEIVSNAAATVTLSGSADGPMPITYQWYKDSVELTGETDASLTVSATYSNAGSYVLRAINANGFTNSPPATLAVISPNPAFVNITNDLVLHLKFDGNYDDSSGRGNNGTAVGTPTIVPGRLGNAAYLNTDTAASTYNYVTLGKPVDLNFSSNVNFSVAYWVKLNPGQTNGDLPFLSSSINSYGGPGFTFAPSYNDGGWSYSLNGAVQLYGPDNSINDGNWHYLLHTFDRNGQARTFLDGALADSRYANGAGNLDTGNTINVGQGANGTYAESGSMTLDDLAVWRRALTSYEAYAAYYAATNSNLSFDTPGTVTLTIGMSGTNAVLVWQPGATLGTLLQADNLNGPWTPVAAYAPVYVVPASVGQKFYRVLVQ